MLGAAGISQAQNVEPGDKTGEPKYESAIEQVVVTGSRLIHSPLDSPSPVTVYDAEALLDNGIATLDEFARYLPQNADNFSDSNSTGSRFRGSSGFNLRGIGLDGTLTLVNGRRVAPFGAAGDVSPFVDVNAIPVTAIERIEVLKDGASAIYGSEAVGGVVNIITKKNIEGIAIDAGYLVTSEGDGAEWDVSIAGGWASNTTRFNATLSYFERDEIFSRDRVFSRELDLTSRGGRNNRSTLSSPPTIDLLESRARLADPECPDQTQLNSRLEIVPGVFEFCLFNWAQFTTLQNPADRLALTAYLDHDIGNGVLFFAELIYSKNETLGILAPTPIFNAFVPAFHPNNPFGENLLIRARPLDIGARAFNAEASTWRGVAGLSGSMADWDWEAAVMQSESDADDERLSGILAKEFNDALAGRGGPGGDQFYNPFGLKPANSQEVIDQFVRSGTRSSSSTKELTLDFQITGGFGALAGGPIGVALGVQAREQSLTQGADEEELTGVFVDGSGFDPIDAKRDIYSVFAEFLLPLHHKFEIQFAARFDDYSDFGSTTNPKIGLGWRPVEDLLVRATWGTSFRPPTFRELFAPRVEGFSFGFVFNDPWRCPVTGDFFDCNGRQVESSFQGNPELESDEGENMLLGVAWEPDFVPGLSLSVDLWQIKHDNRILESSDFFLADLILQLLDPFTNPFTGRAEQTPQDVALGIPGIILETTDTFFNGGVVNTRGIDFDLKYSWETEHAGVFTGNLNYTYLDEYEFGLDFMGAVHQEELAGRYGFSNGLPKHRANLRLGWERKANGLSALISYAGKYESFISLHVDGQDTGNPFVVDDYYQIDLQYSHVFEGLHGSMLRIGCRNCLDEDPPVYNYTVNSEAFHDGRGAMFYLRWTHQFQ